MILSTCCYVKKNAGLSFDELHSVVGVASSMPIYSSASCQQETIVAPALALSMRPSS
jgi:hypothetical protein